MLKELLACQSRLAVVREANRRALEGLRRVAALEAEASARREAIFEEAKRVEALFIAATVPPPLWITKQRLKAIVGGFVAGCADRPLAPCVNDDDDSVATHFSTIDLLFRSAACASAATARTQTQSSFATVAALP